jgi:hypothetical protein
MNHDLTRRPWARARADLAYGSWLRGQRRDGASLAVLESALGAFDRIGASVWADRARTELAAALAGQHPAQICLPGH